MKGGLVPNFNLPVPVKDMKSEKDVNEIKISSLKNVVAHADLPSSVLEILRAEIRKQECGTSEQFSGSNPVLVHDSTLSEQALGNNLREYNIELYNLTYEVEKYVYWVTDRHYKIVDKEEWLRNVGHSQVPWFVGKTPWYDFSKRVFDKIVSAIDEEQRELYSMNKFENN